MPCVALQLTLNFFVLYYITHSLCIWLCCPPTIIDGQLVTVSVCVWCDVQQAKVVPEDVTIQSEAHPDQ